MTPPTLPDTVGYLAALLTTSSFVPQAVLTLRTRDVSGISLSMYSAFTLGVALWLLYGIAIGEWPVILANVVTLALAATILVTKVRVERAHATTAQGAASGAASETASTGSDARR
jgi:MtN3 and saliva related transmembrane protein